MTKIGNKTIFEVGTIFDDNLQVVFSGEITGEQASQKDFFNYLSNLSTYVYKTYTNTQTVLQKKIINKTLDDEDIKDPSRKKPPESVLYKIWERDNWTCVYCSKQLLDPKTVKKASMETQNSPVAHVDKIREHLATYDHHLPVSKLPQFNFDEENLFASCMECNMKKSDSMGQKTWKPNRQNSWNKPLEICGLLFSNPETFNKILTRK